MSTHGFLILNFTFTFIMVYIVMNWELPDGKFALRSLHNKLENIEYAAKTGTDRIELYTEPYATEYFNNKEKAIAPFIAAAQLAKNLGLGVNAGHDLSLENLAYFNQNIPWLDEVSIGHALICDALYLGLKETISKYKACLQNK